MQDPTTDIEQDIRVGYGYRVQFTRGAFDPSNPLLRDALRAQAEGRAVRAMFVVDGGLADHHPGLIEAIDRYVRAASPAIALAGPVIIVPGGEAAKNDPAHLHRLYQAVNDVGLCRHSYLVAVGGGAVLDLAGYAAATAHRGVRHIRMPSTVLAQNDSGVGVKNGVNAFGKKNFLGTFSPPNCVINDLDLLATLSRRDWLAGTSEAVKVALIKDRAFFEWIAANAAPIVERDAGAMQRLIHRCAQLHAAHIGRGGDPFEKGASRPLDFGHWAAHKIEQMADFRVRHGEAVAIGMMLDVTYSGLIGSLGAEDVNAIRSCLASLDLPLFDASMRQADRLLQGLEEFREHLGGELTITLLRGIGQGYEVHSIDRNLMRQAMDQLAAVAA